MAIPKEMATNFETMLRAAAAGDLALLECTKDGKPAYVITAIAFDGKDYLMTPFGEMANGNPFDMYQPPEN